MSVSYALLYTYAPPPLLPLSPTYVTPPPRISYLRQRAPGLFRAPASPGTFIGDLGPFLTSEPDLQVS